MRTLRLAFALALLPAVALAYEGGHVENGATVRGSVRLVSAPPRLAPREVFVDRNTCGLQVPDESIALGPAQEIRNAVVTVEGIERGKPIETETFNVLRLKGCQFVPHVLAAQTGQWLMLANEDRVQHRPEATLVGDRKHEFHVGVPPGKSTRRVLLEPGLMKVGCNERHSWMDAYVVVTEHPYVSVTDGKGAFELRDVPPGRYTLKIWHERLGLIERPITVGANAEVVEEIAYQRR